MNPVISLSSEYSCSITGSGHFRRLRCSKCSQLLALFRVTKEHYDPGICNDAHVKDEVTMGSRQTGLVPLS